MELTKIDNIKLIHIYFSRFYHKVYFLINEFLCEYIYSYLEIRIYFIDLNFERLKF